MTIIKCNFCNAEILKEHTEQAQKHTNSFRPIWKGKKVDVSVLIIPDSGKNDIHICSKCVSEILMWLFNPNKTKSKAEKEA